MTQKQEQDFPRWNALVSQAKQQAQEKKQKKKRQQQRPAVDKARGTLPRQTTQDGNNTPGCGGE